MRTFPIVDDTAGLMVSLRLIMIDRCDTLSYETSMNSFFRIQRFWQGNRYIPFSIGMYEFFQICSI